MAGGVDHAARADTGDTMDDSRTGDVLAAQSFEREQAKKVRARQMIANYESLGYAHQHCDMLPKTDRSSYDPPGATLDIPDTGQ